MKVTIIDYGLSNLLSVERGFRYFDVQTEVTGDRDRIAKAEVLVLPGVGAFMDGMKGLDRLGLPPVIRSRVEAGVPLLGICLGMQMMFESSDEFGQHKGLGLIAGRVERILDEDTEGQRQRVPHVGWEELVVHRDCGNPGLAVLGDLSGGEECYFVHSYEGKPQDPGCYLAHCNYGGRPVCAVAANPAGNAIGCQFHPEKSGEVGLSVIGAFVRMAQQRG